MSDKNDEITGSEANEFLFFLLLGLVSLLLLQRADRLIGGQSEIMDLVTSRGSMYVGCKAGRPSVTSSERGFG